MARRIKFTGTEPESPPASRPWNPGEEQDIDDADVVERLLRNPIFQEVRQTKQPPKPGDVPADQPPPTPEPPTLDAPIAPEEPTPAEGR
jgi:hypothetical protein